jgi:hypothetical protein
LALSPKSTLIKYDPAIPTGWQQVNREGIIWVTMPFEIITTSNMGFCQGVRRAIERVLDVAKDQPKLETLGALVHNKEVHRRRKPGDKPATGKKVYKNYRHHLPVCPKGSTGSIETTPGGFLCNSVW